ncbi:hypothetical protein WJU23_19880 [Prosthecobacter sp. SYSU 5D2]|uniref:hypothetical protein n=1 Tax=Prosthecobacter sp. SYSU 5D2 TaxID=3134134 RepID=UPI0031FE5ED1
MKINYFAILLLAVYFASRSSVVNAQERTPSEGPDGAVHKETEDYVTDLDIALKLAKKTDRKVILYTGHIHHLRKHGMASPKIYFDTVLVKASPLFLSRRSEFVVCERFEFTAMHDSKGNFTPEFFKFSKGWFGELNKLYDIRFFTPTLTLLDGDGKKLAGPFDNFAGFAEAITSALKKIPSASP